MKIKKILIIRWSGMGDIIMTIPALSWLKATLKNCHITYLTDTAFIRIPELSGFVDKSISIDRQNFKNPKFVIPSIIKTLKTISYLKEKKFDIAFDLQGFGETAVLAYFSGAPLKVGRISKSFPRNKIYNIPITCDWSCEHRSVFFVKAVSCALNFDHISFSSSDYPKLSIKKSLSKRIGLNIGSSTENRRWSEKNFFELAKSLVGKGFLVRFFVGPHEKKIIPLVKKICINYNWEFSYNKDMDSLIKNLTECILLVSNDTGPGHLAAALDIPVITLFSTGDPDNVRPLIDKAKWFRNQSDINQIKVLDVEKACIDLTSI